MASLMMMLSASSCSDDPNGTHPVARLEKPTMAVTIGLSGPRAGEGTAADPGFELGSDIENYLDIINGNFRIYIFDSDGKYFSRYKPYNNPMTPNLEDINNVTTAYYYKFEGEVPVDMPLKFKLVVLANWDSYPEEADAPSATGAFELVKGTTTIADMCGHSEARFSHLSPVPGSEGYDAWLSKGGRLIPFYGVREYDLTSIASDKITDGKLKPDAYVDLSGQENALPLLRALAKVEVILDNEFAAFHSVSITGVNNQGYSAPKNATLHTDYFNPEYDWDKNFMRDLHLVNNDNNDNDATSRTVSLTKVAPNKWVAYIPEYRNITAGNNYCYLTVMPADPAHPDTPLADDYARKIYFATAGSEVNNTDVDATNTMRFNVERNNIYRFTIRDLKATVVCDVDIQPYAEQKLNAIFGLNFDERGDLMVEFNSEGKLPENVVTYLKTFGRGRWPVMGHVYNSNGEPQEEVELIPNWEEGDYYAFVLNETGEMNEAEIWLKDRDGYKVLSNYRLRAEGDTENNQDCSARYVERYFGADADINNPYIKDKDGDRRLQHNTDHSTVVYDPDDVMIFKDAANTIRRLVESWDKTSGVFWYEKSRSHTIDPTTGDTIYTFTYQEADISGNDTTTPTKTFTEVHKKNS